MYRIMCDRIWEKKMKFGCCKQLWAVVNREVEWTWNRGFAVVPHPCWETCYCFSARTRGTRCFSSLLSLGDELSSASGNSRRFLSLFTLIFFWICSVFLPQLLASLQCSSTFQEVLIANGTPKKINKIKCMIITFIHNACLYIYIYFFQP